MDQPKKQTPKKGLECPQWYLNEVQKGKVANKVLAGKKLTKNEKRLVFKSLTGVEPVWKNRGRPTKKDRDMALAFEFLLAWSEDRHLSKIVTLKNKHDIKGHSRNTFYEAVKRGRKEWKNLLIAAQRERCVAKGFASFFLETIEKYERKAQTTTAIPKNLEKIN